MKKLMVIVVMVLGWVLLGGCTSPYRPQLEDTYSDMCVRLGGPADWLEHSVGWVVAEWYPWRGADEYLVRARFEGSKFLSEMRCVELYRNNHVWERLAPRR